MNPVDEQIYDTRDTGAFIPSNLDDHGLDPYEFRIYARMVRRAGRGQSWESVPNMARACLMSERKVRYAIAFLVAAGMVKKENRSSEGLSNVYKLTPANEWKHPDYFEELRKSIQKNTPPAPGATLSPARDATPPAYNASPPCISCKTPPAPGATKGTPIEGTPSEGYPIKKESFVGKPDRAQEERINSEPQEQVKASLTPATEITPSPVNDRGSVEEKDSAANSTKKEKSYWDLVVQVYNESKPKLWAKCNSIGDKRKRSLTTLGKQLGRQGLLDAIANALAWARQDPFWNSKDLDFDNLLRENRIVSWSERWEAKSQRSPQSNNPLPVYTAEAIAYPHVDPKDPDQIAARQRARQKLAALRQGQGVKADAG